MIEGAPSHEYQRAVALRQETWDLLEEYTDGRAGEERDPKVIVGLQDAANRIGAVERLLLEYVGDSRDALPSVAPPVSERVASAREASAVRPSAEASGLRPTAEAAIVLTLAEVFVPLAASPADEAERWLRVMHGYGTVGRGLQRLGMPSAQLSTPSLARSRGPSQFAAVTAEAAYFAGERGAPAIATIDVLFAAISVYGPLFDRALYAATSKRRSDLFAAVVGREHVSA